MILSNKQNMIVLPSERLIYEGILGQMFRKVADFMEKYNMIKEGDLVAAGVSGGADSLCLLFMLLEYRKKVAFDLVVVHVNHGIRREAVEDAKFVQNLCEKEKIPFFLREVSVREIAKEKKWSEEEAGREVRYEAFRMALEKYGNDGPGKIAVAHHEGDSAETLLFHLFRGTGIWGMAGILPVNGEIIRPLLCCSRTEIEEYLESRGCKWCVDNTNNEDTYTRNKIRHHIIPYAREEINEKSVEHLAQTALQMNDLRQYLIGEMEKMESEVNIVGREEGIDIEKLKKYPPFLQNQYLLWFVGQKMPGRRDVTFEHIQALYGLLEKEGTKKLDLPGSMEAVKEYETLWIRKKNTRDEVDKSGSFKSEILKQKEKTQQEISLEKEGKYMLENGDFLEISFIERKDFEGIKEKKYTKYLDYDKINSCLSLRYRQAGDFLTINDMGQKKTLKEYFIHEKIPADTRGDLPLIAEKNHILWIIGYRISAYYKVTEKTKKIIQMKVWRKGHGREN